MPSKPVFSQRNKQLGTFVESPEHYAAVIIYYQIFCNDIMSACKSSVTCVCSLVPTPTRISRRHRHMQIWHCVS